MTVDLANSTTARTKINTLKNTKLISFRTVDEMVAKMKAGEVDAIEVPKNHPAALAYVSEFIEEAKASGIVRRAFDRAGMQGARVAPSSTK